MNFPKTPLRCSDHGEKIIIESMTSAIGSLIGSKIIHDRENREKDGVTSFKVVRSHSLGEFWKSALHKSMSAKAPGAPGAGEGGERMDNDGAKQ